MIIYGSVQVCDYDYTLRRSTIKKDIRTQVIKKMVTIRPCSDVARL